METRDTFEATYLKYPFAPLVRLGIGVATFLSGRARSNGATHGAGGIVGDSLGSAA